MFRASETLLYAFTVNHENIPPLEQSVKRAKQKIGEQNGTTSRYAQGKQEKIRIRITLPLWATGGMHKG